MLAVPGAREVGRFEQAGAHGAAALETALVEPPAVVIVQPGLPLTAGAHLGQILLANPVTGDVGRVVLVDTTADARGEGLPA